MHTRTTASRPAARTAAPRAARERKPYSLVLLSCVASSTLHAARGLLEWLSDELQKEFNFTCANPLACK